jgi:hypothetical protein
MHTDELSARKCITYVVGQLASSPPLVHKTESYATRGSSEQIESLVDSFTMQSKYDRILPEALRIMIRE